MAHLFPNPGKDLLYVSLEDQNINGVVNVLVFDTKGQRIASKMLNYPYENSLDVSGMASGLYHVVIETAHAVFLALIFIINKDEIHKFFSPFVLFFQNYLSVSLNDDAQPKLRLGYISYNDDPASKKQFTYDAEGRLSSCVTGLDSILYIYCADSIIQYNRHPDKFWEYKTSFVLDPSDKALNAWTYDGFGNKVREKKITPTIRKKD